MRESSFDAGAVRLNVAVGPRNGPPLVLLHGVTRCWQDFRPILPGLAFDHEVHVLDFRGHGRSGRVPGGYRVVDYVPDVVGYLSGAVSAPAAVVGHSLGGMVAAAVAAAVPERVRAVVLEDPTFEMTGRRVGETSFPDLFRAFREHAGSGRPVGEIAASLGEAPIRAPGRVEPVRLGELRDAVSLRFSAACLKHLDPDVLTTPLGGGWLDGYDVPGTLAGVRAPTLILQSEFKAGGALPDEYAGELVGGLADGVLVRLLGVGHNVHGTVPETMLRLMAGFLDSID